MEALIKRLAQPEIYRRLQSELGSAWLKKHVLFADSKMVVFNKPPNLICQLDSSVKPHEVCLLYYYTAVRDSKMQSERTFML